MSVKNKLHNRAFTLRDQHKTLTQQEADELNFKLNVAIQELQELGYDPLSDYIVNFNSFVPANTEYNRFMW